MALLGNGLLGIWHDVEVSDNADLSDFHNWYRTEHFPERLRVPGFMRGRRYQSVDSNPRFSALYETENLATLASNVYREQLDNPTLCSQRNLARFRNTNRTAFNIEYSAGFGVGGALAVISIVPMNSKRNLLKSWCTEDALPNILHDTGIIGVHLCISDPVITKVDSVEAQIRDAPDQIADWAILIESRDQKTLSDAITKDFSMEECRNNGAQTASITQHRLMHCASAGEASNFSL